MGGEHSSEVRFLLNIQIINHPPNPPPHNHMLRPEFDMPAGLEKIGWGGTSVSHTLKRPETKLEAKRNEP